jgi:hypothetical protein
MNNIRILLALVAIAVAGCRAQEGAPAAAVAPTPTPGVAPLAVPDVVVVEINSLANPIAALGNDIDVSGTGLTITGVIVDQTLPPMAGAAASTDGSTISFTPPPNYTGVVTLQYAIRDGAGATSSALVAVSVLPVSLPPVALPDAATVLQDSGATDIDVLANDVDFSGGGLQLTAVSIAGSVPPATHTIAMAGDQVRFTPAAGYIGAVVVTYTATDVNGATASSVLTIVVSPLDLSPGPVPVPDAAVVAQDSSATTIDVLANDIDVAGAGLTLGGVTVTSSLPAGAHTVATSANQVQFTPVAGFAGIVVITYTAVDGDGNTADGVLTVTVSPLALPVGPIAIPDVALLAQDAAPTDIDVVANDIDFAGGGLTLTGASVTSSLPAGLHTVAIAGNRVRFTPAAGFAGVVVVTYTARDIDNLTYNGVLSIQVTPAALALPPVALPDARTVSSSAGAVLIDVLANDVNPAGGSLTLTSVSILTQVPVGAGAVAIVGNQVQYTPTLLYSGAVLVTYEATDVNGNTTVGQLSLVVTL